MTAPTTAPPVLRRLARQAGRLAELDATPLVPADYVDLLDPLRSGAELRGRGLQARPCGWAQGGAAAVALEALASRLHEAGVADAQPMTVRRRRSVRPAAMPTAAVASAVLTAPAPSSGARSR